MASVNITHLPNEMLEVIFGFLDSTALMSASNVCQKWFPLAQRLLESEKYWECSCLRDFTDYQRYSAIEGLGSDKWKWSLVGQCINRWQVIQDWNVNLKPQSFGVDLRNLNHPIIARYYINSDSMVLNFLEQGTLVVVDGKEVAFFEESVSSLLFVVEDIIIDLELSKVMKPFQNTALIEPRERIRLASNCYQICRAEEIIVYYHHATQCIYILYYRPVVTEYRKQVKTINRGDVVKFVARNFQTGNVVALIYWKKTIKLLNEFGFLMEVDRDSLKTRYKYPLPSDDTLRVSSLFVYGPYVFLITDGAIHVLDTEVHRTKMYQTSTIFPFRPVQIALHGDLLLVRDCNCSIYVYYANNLFNIDFKYYAHKVVCENTSIMIMDVREQPDKLSFLISTVYHIYHLILKDDHLTMEKTLSSRREPKKNTKVLEFNV